MKVTGQCILCTYIKPKNITHMNCAIYFSDECTKYIIPQAYLYYGPNAILIASVFMHIKVNVKKIA